MEEKSKNRIVGTYIAVDLTRCSGCRCCELVCSLFHYGECNLELVGINIIKDTFSGDYLVNTCRQCEEPRCQLVCPVEAIYVDEKTGAKIIDDKKCIGCRACEEECQFQMVKFLLDKNVCFKCDMCGGEPQCVRYCPFAALTIAET